MSDEFPIYRSMLVFRGVVEFRAVCGPKRQKFGGRGRNQSPYSMEASRIGVLPLPSVTENLLFTHYSSLSQEEMAGGAGFCLILVTCDS